MLRDAHQALNLGVLLAKQWACWALGPRWKEGDPDRDHRQDVPHHHAQPSGHRHWIKMDRFCISDVLEPLRLSWVSHASLASSLLCRHRKCPNLMTQTDDNCWESKSQRIEKMLWRRAVLQFILCITMKGGGAGRITWKPLVVDEGRWRKQSGEPWDWIQVKWRDTCFFYIGGHRIVHEHYSTQRWLFRETMQVLWSAPGCGGWFLALFLPPAPQEKAHSSAHCLGALITPQK